MRFLLVIAMILANQLQGNLGTVHAAEIFADVSLSSPPAALDGVTLVSDRKYLLAGQADPTENGIVYYNGSTLARPAKDESLESGASQILLGSEVYVRAGAIAGSEKFRLFETDSTAVDGYENDILTIGTHEQFYRRVGNRPGQFLQSFEAAFPGALLMDGASTLGNAASGADYAGEHFRWAFDRIKSLAPNAGSEDFDADDTVTMFDGRGRVAAGRDDMGGSAASRITVAGSGINGTVIGASGGAETVGLTSAQNGPHTHTVYGKLIAGDGSGRRQLASGSNNDVTSESSGDGTPHQNTPPTFVANTFLCL